MKKVLVTFMILSSAFGGWGTVLAQATDSFNVNVTIGGDTTAPTAPVLTATPVSMTEIDLSWTASTDNLAVEGYQIFRDGSPIATTTAGVTTYDDSGLSSDTTYEYTVRAFDAAGNYSAHSAPVEATTFATPDEVAPEPTAPQTSNLLTYESMTVNAIPGMDRIVLAVSSPVPFSVTAVWSADEGPLLGAAASSLLQQEHLLTLAGLSSATTYFITVTGVDSVGRTITKTLAVTTLSGGDTEPPANPSFFTGTPREDGIFLTWKNPADADFDTVRIMRVAGGIPTDPYDGVPVYEGSLEAFLDRDVIPGVAYGYAIFARDHAGNFSSGAVVYVRAFGGEGVDDTGIVIPPDASEPVGSALFGGLTLVQDGRVVPPRKGVFSIRPDLPFGLALSADVAPRALKTILVTLADPADPRLTFSFILRRNDAGTHYIAQIGALERAGDFLAALSIMDYQTQTVESVRFTIRTSVPAAGIVPTAIPASFVLVALILIALIALFWFVIAIIRRRRKEEVAAA